MQVVTAGKDYLWFTAANMLYMDTGIGATDLDVFNPNGWLLATAKMPDVTASKLRAAFCNRKEKNSTMLGSMVTGCSVPVPRM